MASKTTILVEEYENLPEPFVASIKEGKYRGIVIQEKTMPDCLEQMAISIRLHGLTDKDRE